MTAGEQQDLFGAFAPEAGVHRTPPAHAAGRAVTDGAAAIVFERSPRARRYRLTLRRDGVAVATIPARGSVREAERFVAQHHEWFERARERQRHRPRAAVIWAVGTRVPGRGGLVEI